MKCVGKECRRADSELRVPFAIKVYRGLFGPINRNSDWQFDLQTTIISNWQENHSPGVLGFNFGALDELKSVDYVCNASMP